jgi:hypothetical protein
MYRRYSSTDGESSSSYSDTLSSSYLLASYCTCHTYLPTAISNLLLFITVLSTVNLPSTTIPNSFGLMGIACLSGCFMIFAQLFLGQPALQSLIALLLGIYQGLERTDPFVVLIRSTLDYTRQVHVSAYIYSLNLKCSPLANT